MKNKELEEKLVIGCKIRVGKEYAKFANCKEGEVMELLEGYFESDNGGYTTTETCPSVWDDKIKDFDSIYHMFGNDLENFLDCEIIWACNPPLAGE